MSLSKRHPFGRCGRKGCVMTENRELLAVMAAIVSTRLVKPVDRAQTDKRIAQRSAALARAILASLDKMEEPDNGF